MNKKSTDKFRKDINLKYRILAFCWDNPALEKYCVNFIDEISNYIKILPIFIVPSLLSKLRFLKKNIHAFTYQELITYSSQFGISVNDNYSGFNKKILTDLSEYDRTVRWAWVPNQNLTEEEFYIYQSLKIINAYNFIWKNIRPHLAITWNGVTLLQKALVVLAHASDVPILFLERGLLPQTLYVDTEGVNYKSSIAGQKWFNKRIPYPDKRKIKMAEDYCKKLREEKQSVVEMGDALSIEAIKKKLDIRASSKVMLFPMQIEADSNILYYSPHYSNMIEIIKDIQRAMAQFNDIDIHLIVKLHPEDRDRLNELRSLTNNNTHIVDDVNLYSLLELANLVITVNSTVGLEALLFQKPVIVLGKAIYAEKGFTYDLLEKQNLSHLLRLALKKHNFYEKKFYRYLIHILKYQLFQFNPEQDYFDSRRTIAKKIVELIKKQKSDIDDIIIGKLYENINFQKIFEKTKIVFLGPIDEKFEVLLGKPEAKILHPKEAIKFLLSNLFSKNKPYLILATKPLSFKRKILFKLIRSNMKAMLTNNDMKFVKKCN